MSCLYQFFDQKRKVLDAPNKIICHEFFAEELL